MFNDNQKEIEWLVQQGIDVGYSCSIGAKRMMFLSKHTKENPGTIAIKVFGKITAKKISKNGKEYEVVHVEFYINGGDEYTRTFPTFTKEGKMFNSLDEGSYYKVDGYIDNNEDVILKVYSF